MKQATNDVPIVMAAAGDPVGTGLVASLSRPGGNVTGISAATPRHFLDRAPKPKLLGRSNRSISDQGLFSFRTWERRHMSPQHQGKFIAYFRVSTDKQGKSGLGLEAQRKAVLDYLNGGRWSLEQEFVEIESGKHSERP